MNIVLSHDSYGCIKQGTTWANEMNIRWSMPQVSVDLQSSPLPLCCNCLLEANSSLIQSDGNTSPHKKDVHYSSKKMSPIPHLCGHECEGIEGGVEVTDEDAATKQQTGHWEDEGQQGDHLHVGLGRYRRRKRQLKHRGTSFTYRSNMVVSWIWIKTLVSWYCRRKRQLKHTR